MDTTLSGTENNDTLTPATDAPATQVLGLQGNDTLTARFNSSTVDTLLGGAGDDTYVLLNSAPVIELGDDFGRDTVRSPNLYSTFQSGAYTLQLASAYRASDARITLVNDGAFEPSRWVLSFDGSDDQITFMGWASGASPSLDHMDRPGQIASSTFIPDRIAFGDGVVWTRADFTARSADAAQTGLYVLGAGTGGALTSAGNQAQVLLGSAARDTLVASDTADLLAGQGGDDDYLLGSGWGTDTASSISGSLAQAARVSVAGPLRVTDTGGTDRLVFTDGTQASQIALNREGFDLVISHGDGRRILINGAINERYALGSQMIEQIVFADGSTLDVAAQFNNLMTGTTGIDTLSGDVGNDTLLGLAGDDILDGGWGNDRLDGGQGNDLLLDTNRVMLDPVRFGDNAVATGGQDTFVFGIGYGHDTVRAMPGLWAGEDTLELGEGIAIAGLRRVDLSDGRSGVQLQIAGTADTLDIEYLGSSPIATVRVAGQTLNWVDFLAQVQPPVSHLQLAGTSGRDTLTGGAGNDTLGGLAGNDLLQGQAGNDLLDGGAGADTLSGGLGNDRVVGGKGNDVYLYGRGDGQDTLVDQDSTWFNSDALRLSDITSRQLWLTRSGNDLQLSVVGTTDRVTIEGWYASSANRVEKIVASDGKTLTAAKVNSLVSAMASLTPPAVGETTLPAATLASLNTTLNRSWT